MGAWPAYLGPRSWNSWRREKQGAQHGALQAEILAFLGGYSAADGRVRWGREYLITRAIRC